MNKKIYVSNLPFQAGEPELKALSPKAGDVHIMGSPESCFHAESERFHGENFAGKRGESQPWLPKEMVIKI
jgi:hypothetical protein